MYSSGMSYVMNWKVYIVFVFYFELNFIYTIELWIEKSTINSNDCFVFIHTADKNTIDYKKFITIYMCIVAKNLYTYHMHISLTKQKAIDFKLQFKQNIIQKCLFNRQSI